MPIDGIVYEVLFDQNMNHIFRMDFTALIDICIKGLKGFDAETQAADIRLQDILDNNPQLDDSEENFVVEVFSGCVRHHALLVVTVENFYLDEGKKMLRKDCILYRIFSYLALFRLDDLGFQNFESFVAPQDNLKMYSFLKYLFDLPKLQSWLKSKWCNIYDSKFVEDSILPNLLNNMDRAEKLISNLNDKLQNKPQPKKESTHTQPKPFSLTKVKPRSVPLPEPVPKVKPTNPIPSSTYKSPREEMELAKKKEEHRKRSEQMLDRVRTLSANHTKTVKSTKTQERLNTIVKDSEAQLKFDSYKARPVPKKIMESAAPIKLNAAAIMREDALYTKKEEEELKKIVGVLSGEGTDDDFQTWKKQRDEELRMEEAEERARKKMIGMLSYEEAMLAKQKLTEMNKQKVKRLKVEADKMLKEYLISQLQLEEEIRERVLEIQDGHQQAKDAQFKLQEVKRKMVQEVHAESKALMQIAFEESAREMERKMKMIQEIRAFDRTPTSTAKFVDLTSTAGFGFLCEMSIAELRERIALIKEEEARELEEKRGDILAEKVSYKKMIEQKLEAISHNRGVISQETAKVMEEKKKLKSPPQVRSTEIDAMQKKLEEKRAERMKYRQTQQMTMNTLPVKRSVNLEAEKRAMEERRWKELERTRERVAQMSTKSVGYRDTLLT